MKRSLFWLIPALIIVFLFSFHTIIEPDMGYHQAAARWILTHKTWPQTDSFTYTVPNNPYIDLHWLYQLCAWSIWQLGGPFVYVLIHSLFIVLAFGITSRLSQKTGVTNWIITAMVLLGAMASDHRFSVRPEVVSWVLMMMLMTLLESWTKSQKTSESPGDLAEESKSHILFFIPIIMLLWVNIQGLFIVGLAIIFCYVIDDLLRYRRVHLPLWLSAIVSLAAVFANPYGWRGAIFPLTLSTRLSGENAFAKYIGEFLSPWSMPFPDTSSGTHFMLASYFILAIAIPLLLLITWRKQPIRYWLLTIIFSYLAAQAIRNIPLFVLVTVPIGAHALASFQWPKTWQRAGTCVVLMVTLGLGAIIYSGYWHQWTKKQWRPGYALTNDFLPVHATNFLIEKNLKGRILNELRHGGYLTWRWNQPVFIDGRLEVMQHDFFEYYIEARRKKSPWKPVEDYDIQFALFSYKAIPSWLHQFMSNDQWRLVYRDEENVVFLKEGFRGDIPKIEWQ